MPNWKKLVVSGSDAVLNKLNVTNGITGSLFGSASWSTNALTSSVASTINVRATASNATFYLTMVDSENVAVPVPELLYTAQALGLGFVPITANPANSSITANNFIGTASLAGTASMVNTIRATDNKFYFLTFVDSNNSTSTGELVHTQVNLTYNPSTEVLFATSITSSFTGNLTGTASWATNALTASYLLGGSSGTPGGANKTIQFNGAGAFSGSNNFTFDSSSNQVQLTGSLIVSGNINTADRAIIGPEGQQAINYDTRRLLDSNGGRSIRWEDRWLINGSGITVTDWENVQLTIGDGASSYISTVDWGSSLLNVRDTTAGTPYTPLTTVDWGQRLLYGSDGGTPQAPLTSIDWQNRYLFDQNGNPALLYADIGTSDQVRLYGTASLALTASYVENLPKAGSGSAASFGGSPLTASITFTTPFSNNLYAITVTGEDARSWTIQSKVSGSFVINSNSSTALTGPVYWIASPFAS